MEFTSDKEEMPVLWMPSQPKEMDMTDIVTLKMLCAEIKVDPRVGRQKLRLAIKDAKTHPELAKAHKPRTPWQWIKDSNAEKEARAVISKGDKT